MHAGAFVFRLFFIALACVLLLPASYGAEAPDDLPYPQGKAFPVMIYGVPGDDIPAVSRDGYNLFQAYTRPPRTAAKPWADVTAVQAWLKRVRQHKRYASVPLSEEDLSANWEEADIIAQMEKLSPDPTIAWWYLPEEMTWTDDAKFGRLKTVSGWARKHDPQRRPTFEYLAGNYIAYDLRNYVPYVDVIGIGSYIDYNEQPRQWVRWAVRQTIQGIEEAGYTVGPDYLGRQRVPAATLQLFVEGGTHRANGPETYHDVWNAVCAGAKAIVVFSWNHRNELPAEVTQAYAKAAKQLTQQPGLGKAILFGEQIATVTADVTEGPKATPPFDAWGGKGITFPTVNLLCIRDEGNTFIIAVNDSDKPIKVTFRGVPGNAGRIDVIDEKRSLESSDGGFSDVFAPWGVHLYQLR